MTAKGHFIFALTNVIFAKKIGLSIALAQGNWGHIIIGAMLTSLLPDIDHPKALLSQRLKFISFFISKLFGHRGFTHSILAIIICESIFTSDYLSSLMPIDLIHAMIVGYISHILADMLTSAGVPLLWPYQYRFCLPVLNSSKNYHRERIFCSTLLILAIIYPFNILKYIILMIVDFIKNIWQLIYNNLN